MHFARIPGCALCVACGLAAVAWAAPPGADARNEGLDAVQAPLGPEAHSALSLLRDAGGAGVAARAATSLAEGPEVVRSRTVVADVDALLRMIPPETLAAGVGSLGEGIQVGFNLFDDVHLPATFDRMAAGVPAGEGSFVLVGKVTGRPDTHIFLSRCGDVLIADIDARERGRFEIRCLSGDDAAGRAEGGGAILSARQIDRSRLSPCATGPEQVVGDPALIWANPEAAPRNVGGAAGPVVDVLVVYTPSARGSSGGTAAAIEGLIANFIVFTNVAYENSQVPQRVRLVRVQETIYTEGSAGTDLSRLQGNGDGFMDEVHSLRNTWGADLVHLVSNSTGVCGLANLMVNVGPGFASSAFGLTIPSCGGTTFAHELGHNMGCAHDHDNGNIGAYCYSFGHRTALPAQSITIMAYEPGSEIPYYSNPDLMVFGQTIGVSGVGCPADAADNARTLRNTAATVSAFRATVVPNPPPGAFSLLTPADDADGVALAPGLTWSAATGVVEYGVFVSTNPDLSDPVWQRKDVTMNSAFVPADTLMNDTRYYWGVVAFGLGTQTGSSPAVFTFLTRPLADLNGDGVVGAADLAILLGAWGPCPAPPNLCGADITGDGFVNAADLALLLGAWG